MKEIPLGEEITKNPDLVRALEAYSFACDRADFLLKMHPDKEAVAASNLVDQLIEEIGEGKIQIPEIDKDDLLFFVSLGGEKTDPKMIRGKKALRKLQQHVQGITGVSVDRINTVNRFWANQFLSEERFSV